MKDEKQTKDELTALLYELLGGSSRGRSEQVNEKLLKILVDEVYEFFNPSAIDSEAATDNN